MLYQKKVGHLHQELLLLEACGIYHKSRLKLSIHNFLLYMHYNTAVPFVAIKWIGAIVKLKIQNKKVIRRRAEWSWSFAIRNYLLRNCV